MKYTGGCHCGQVRFEVEMDELRSVMECNCSICSKKGGLLAFAPEANFRLLQGESALKDYQFGKKVIHHLFCGECGIGAFGSGAMPDGTKMRAINARCLDDVDVNRLERQFYDGKSL